MGLADDFLHDAGVSAPASAQSLASQFVADAKQAQPIQANPTAQSGGTSLWDQAARQLGLTARAGITGLTSAPAMLGDALNTALNYGIHGVNSVAGSKIADLKMPSAAIQNGLNAFGLPQPANPEERIAQDVASSMAGVSPSVKLGQFLANAASPTVSAIGSGLARLPGMQVTGAAGAGAGGAIAKESGAGPVGQIGAAFLGGGIGAVSPSFGPAAARSIKAMPSEVSGVVKPIIDPRGYVGGQLAQALSPDSEAIARNIRSSQEYVPGSLPTTAQAGATPTLVATEKSFANMSPEFKIALANREAENNAARWQALNSVAKTPEALSEAESIRQAAASPLYDEAHANTANVGQGFIDFARRPAVQQAMQQADTLARNEGATLKWPTPDDRQISGQALDYTSRAIGDMIEAAKRAGNNQQAKALTDAQTYLKNWTAQYVPGVREAAQVYAQHSTPINTMEAGQQISNALGTRAMDANGLPKIQLSPYRTALTQALKSQKYGVEENALTALQGIGQDLQRATISNSLRSPGSDTAYNVAANGWLAKQLYGSDFSGAGNAAKAIGALAAAATGHPMIGLGVLGGGNKAGQFVGDRLNKQLADFLLNPQALLPYLERSPLLAPKPSQQALAEALRRNVNGAAIGTASATRTQP